MEALQPVNLIDGVVVLLLLAAMALGFHRGLSGELARLISVVAAFVVAWLAYRPLALWVFEHTRLEGRPAQAVGFGLAVGLALVVMVLLRLLLKPLIKIVFAGALDRVGGILAGFVRMALTVAIVFMMVNSWPHDYLNRQFGEASLVGRLVLTYGPQVRDRLDAMPVTDKVKASLRESKERIEASWRDEAPPDAAAEEEEKPAKKRLLRWFSRDE